MGKRNEDRTPGGPRGEDDAGDTTTGAGADQGGGVRRQDGPEPYEEDRGQAADAIPESPKGGYDERRPGRGDYPGRGAGESTRPQRGQDDELDARSRWRDADRDERSDRWKDESGDDTSGAS